MSIIGLVLVFSFLSSTCAGGCMTVDNGGKCSSNDCKLGTACVDGKCVGVGRQGEGKSCSDTNQCKMDLYCSGSVGKNLGECKKRLKEGTQCKNEVVLAADFENSCDIGAPCATPCQFGTACETQTDKCRKLYTAKQSETVSSILFCQPWLKLDDKSNQCTVKLTDDCNTYSVSSSEPDFALNTPCDSTCIRVGNDKCVDEYRNYQSVVHMGRQFTDMRMAGQYQYKYYKCMDGSKYYAKLLGYRWTISPWLIAFIVMTFFFIITTIVAVLLLFYYRRKSGYQSIR
jgi:hypothetical protein